MEICRFGPGHRRPGGPHGASGLADAVVWSDARARITEIAFAARALLPPQTSPGTALFIVVSGGGWVQVGQERAAVNHGEAVVWPAGRTHAAWTDGSPMRALVVELPEPGPAAGPLVIEAAGAAVGGRGAPAPSPARGALARRQPSRSDHDESHGEPW